MADSIVEYKGERWGQMIEAWLMTPASRQPYPLRSHSILLAVSPRRWPVAQTVPCRPQAGLRIWPTCWAPFRSNGAAALACVGRDGSPPRATHDIPRYLKLVRIANPCVSIFVVSVEGMAIMIEFAL